MSRASKKTDYKEEGRKQGGKEGGGRGKGYTGRMVSTAWFRYPDW